MAFQDSRSRIIFILSDRVASMGTAVLCTAVTGETTIFLPFQACHLLSENELAFSISPSADFVQTNNKINK